MSPSATRVPRASAATYRSFITPTRAAAGVCQVQYRVAKPTALPVSSRARSCSPSRCGSTSSTCDKLEQGLVAGCNLVEVAVGAQQRQQLWQVGGADHDHLHGTPSSRLS